MPWCFSKKGFDFRLSDLKYKVGGGKQYFSSEGGVFSFEDKKFNYEKRTYSEPAREAIRLKKGEIPARILFSGPLDVFDGPGEEADQERATVDYDDQVLSEFAEAIRVNFSFPDDEWDCDILFVEINASQVKQLPDLGSETILVDKNQQSISPILVGVNLSSRQKNGAACLFMLKGEQTRIVTFANERK